MKSCKPVPSLSTIKQSQTADPLLKEIILRVSDGCRQSKNASPSIRKWGRMFIKLKVINCLLYRKTPCTKVISLPEIKAICVGIEAISSGKINLLLSLSTDSSILDKAELKSSKPVLSLTTIKQSQTADPLLKEIILRVSDGWRQSKNVSPSIRKWGRV